MVSPASRGLFSRAISESGFPTAFSAAHALRESTLFGQRVGCNDVTSLKECLRNTTIKEMLHYSVDSWNPFTAKGGWSPVVDGRLLTELPLTAWRDNKYHPNVDLLVGTNTDEADLFVWLEAEKGMNATSFRDFVHRVINGHDPATALNSTQLGRVLQQYP